MQPPRLNWIRVALIVVAGFWVYAPALQGDWLMDDDFYLPQNALVNDPHRLWKIWFAPGSLMEYYPIEATLQAAQWHWWHSQTLGYHLTNIVLHILGGLLVWRLLGKFQLRWAWLGGLLFTVHPANVESVAWISEFKNTLSLPPFLLALCAWTDFEAQRKPGDYRRALLCFLIAMLCKISMALFPLILLLYAWYRRGRVVGHDFVLAAPFFVISLILGLGTVLVGQWFRAAHLQSAANPDIGGLATRLALAGQSLWFYFTQTILPVNVVPIYPKWPVNAGSPFAYLPWLVVVAALGGCWFKRATWGRPTLLGLGFFLINLLPFIGLNSVTYMGFTWVMDHFLYLPMIGIIGLGVAGWEWLEARATPTWRQGYALFLALLFASLAWKSETYAGVYAGPEELWSYTLAHNPNSWLAHNNLGAVYLETGRLDSAIGEYRLALRDNPDSVEAHTNLGLAFSLAGKTDEAIAEYHRALEGNPHFGLAWANLGRADEKAGRVREAIPEYEEALRINPADIELRATLDRLKARNPE